MICELACGGATEDALDVYPNPIKTKSVSLRPERVEAITSLQVERGEMKRILTALGFVIRAEESTVLSFTVPSWRHDVSIEEDLVEEVARHTGYDNIETSLPPAHHAGEYDSSEQRKRALRLALSALGYSEAINLSFVELTSDFELIPAFKTEAAVVTLTNPIIEEASRMRQTLLPGLLNAIRHNLNHGIRDVCLFELGRVFASIKAGALPTERESLALVATGGVMEANHALPVRELDFFDLKGGAEAAIEAMNLPVLSFEAAAIKHLRPGQAATVSANGTPIGSIGRLSDSISAEYKFRQPVLVAELDLIALLEMEPQPVLYAPLPRYPSIVRDVSLLVDRSVTVADLSRATTDRDTPSFVGVTFVGTYEGEGIPDDKRSVTLRFEYRADDRTMRDEEVDAIHWPLVEALKEKFNAEVR